VAVNQRCSLNGEPEKADPNLRWGGIPGEFTQQTSHLERVRFLYILAILGRWGLSGVNQKAESSRRESFWLPNNGEFEPDSPETEPFDCFGCYRKVQPLKIPHPAIVSRAYPTRRNSKTKNRVHVFRCICMKTPVLLAGVGGDPRRVTCRMSKLIEFN
jgi:hypothetical protein